MVLLNCIVSEMYELVVEIFHIEFFRGSSNVSVLKPIPFLIAIDASNADVRSNIEFSLLVEERHNVLLDDMSAWPSHFVDLIFFN